MKNEPIGIMEKYFAEYAETEKIMGILTIGSVILLLIFSSSFRESVLQSNPEPCEAEYSNMGDGC